jgi:hypothetical protein
MTVFASPNAACNAAMSILTIFIIASDGALALGPWLDQARLIIAHASTVGTICRQARSGL